MTNERELNDETTEPTPLAHSGVRAESFSTLGAGKAGGIDLSIVHYLGAGGPAVRLALLNAGRQVGSVTL
jgi:hypothetical protein